MKSGDNCQKCRSGMMRVYCTRKSGTSAIRYLRCDRCSLTGQQVVPTEIISPRRTKQGTDAGRILN